MNFQSFKIINCTEKFTNVIMAKKKDVNRTEQNPSVHTLLYSRGVTSISLNQPHWAYSVMESCPSVCLRHQVQFFLDLSLALKSHDQFQAS